MEIEPEEVWDRMSASEKQQYIEWMSEKDPRRLELIYSKFSYDELEYFKVAGFTVFRDALKAIDEYASDFYN